MLAGLVLAVLLLRDPYSERTLIPNFEPFPDAFHYVVPPRCFLQGQGWTLCREGVKGVLPAVPPVYGALLLPVFMVSSDPRSFYFVNVALAFISVSLLYLLLKKITTNQVAQLVVLTLFVTTYHVYWVPTLAMAENLLLPILLGIFYLFSFKKLQLMHVAGISILAGLLYGSKFAGLPMMGGVCFILGLRILIEHFSNAQSLAYTFRKMSVAILPVLLLFLTFGGWSVVSSTLNIESLFNTSDVQSAQSDSTWFGSEYFTKNIVIYLQATRGESTRFLWDYTPLISTWMAVLGWLGLGYGLTKKRWVWLSSTALITTVLQLGVLATFYSADTRYIYNLLPTILVGIAFFFVWLKDVLESFSVTNTQLVISIACLLILAGYSFNNFTRLKSQVSINLKYAETPWWYISVNQMNTFIEDYNKQKPESEKQTIVISPMVPYFVDLYSTADFRLLPLDQDQDFRGEKIEVWGEDDYSDLIQLYEQKILDGHPVFVARYGIGNEKPKQNSFAAIDEYFSITKVQAGCFDQCDIFKLQLKEGIQ